MPSEKQAVPLRLRCFDCGGKDFEMVVEKDDFGHHYVRITCADCRREGDYPALDISLGLRDNVTLTGRRSTLSDGEGR